MCGPMLLAARWRLSLKAFGIWRLDQEGELIWVTIDVADEEIEEVEGISSETSAERQREVLWNRILQKIQETEE